ncbi:DUF4145 domain-containing protein [Williamsia deligens]|uniref:DUF4145 domain-containing protein n=1 Tax=Williamsia deligens TaxID=321325 RepID=A0ABW3GAN8_9NOCA|nr:DUF4145 domain-containing protein [Williamsia deligens]
MGDAEVDYNRTTLLNRDDPFETYFTVRYAYPPLRVVQHPADTPKAVQAELRNVGALIWSNPDAAMWTLRKAEEFLLDDQGVEKQKSNGSPIPLNDRLKTFAREKPEYADVSELLLAVKWVGNDSTHGTTRNVREVLKMARFVELALESLYSESDRDAALRHARTINENRRYTAPPAP